jgi:hypothetical protein
METITVNRDAFFDLMRKVGDLEGVMSMQFMDSGVRENRINAAFKAVNNAAKEVQASIVPSTGA